MSRLLGKGREQRRKQDSHGTKRGVEENI